MDTIRLRLFPVKDEPMLKKVACDCLNFCGDDPWLSSGLADYCRERKARMAAERERELEAEKERDLLERLNRIAPDLDWIVAYCKERNSKREKIRKGSAPDV